MASVIMVRGLPGSGKTTLAQQLMTLDKSQKYLSFDVILEKLHVTKITPDLNNKVLHELFRAYENTLDEGTDIIVEGFCEHELVEQYRFAALNKGYKFTSIIVENRHGSNSVNEWHDSKVLLEAQSNFSVRL